jgi:dolichol-phosphate mannosyltransferase
MRTLFVLLPCYNEEKNITPLVEAWLDERDNFAELETELKIVIVDDASTDGTGRAALELCSRFPFVHLIPHEANMGLCGALNTSLRYFSAAGKKGDLICIRDGDYTHPPKYAPPMLRKLNEGYDCVIASRYEKGAEAEGLSGSRKFLSDGAKLYYKAMLRVPGVKDYTCGYRIFTYEIARMLTGRFGMRPLKEKTFACSVELLYKLYLCGARFAECPFTLRYDMKVGESKMKIFKTVKNSFRAPIVLRRLK